MEGYNDAGVQWEMRSKVYTLNFVGKLSEKRMGT